MFALLTCILPAAGLVNCPDSLAVDTLQIPAMRMAFDTCAANVVHVVGHEFFTNLPARGINAALALQPGIVIQGVNAIGEPDVHFRGGRGDEAAYAIEGVNVTNVLYGGRGLSFTAEAIDEMRVQGGGNAAEGSAPGMMQVQLRTGPADRWTGSLIAETDRYTPMNTRSLGGYSYGYSDWTGTIGGPVPGLGNALRLFGSAQNSFYRDPSVSVRSGWNFTGANSIVTDPNYTPGHPTLSRPDTLSLALPGGNALGGQDNRWILMGTALLDLSPATIRFSGSYSYDRSRTPTALKDLLNLSRLPLNIERDGFFNAKFTHDICPAVSYSASFNYYARTFLSEDPDLQGNLFAYGDPAANAALGYNLQTVGGKSYNWPAYTYFGWFPVDQPGMQIAGYQRDSERSWGWKFGLDLRFMNHRVNLGIESTQYTIRRYNPYNVFFWWNLRNRYPNASDLETALIGSGIESYGYDAWGHEIDHDDIRNPNIYGGTIYYLGPRRPVLGTAYLQDVIDFSDLALSLGIRFDYIDPDSKNVPSSGDLYLGSSTLPEVSEILRTVPTALFFPRIGLSFRMDEGTKFHAHYGRYLKEPELNDSYAGAWRIGQFIVTNLSLTNLFGWGVQPVESNQYEAGVSRVFSDLLSGDLTLFYKSIQNQLTIGPSIGGNIQYLALVNGDFSTVKGFEISISLARTHHASARFTYTLEDARGTGSKPTGNAGFWAAGSIVQTTQYERPLDFNETQRGSIDVDYRFARGEGGDVLEEMGLNLLATFNSGHNLTILRDDQLGPAPSDPRYQIPVGLIGSATTPWFFQLDARLDRQFWLGPILLDAYVYVINLLGTDNAVDVFARTGDPAQDGWLQTSPGRQTAQDLGPQFVAFYKSVYDGKNSGNWGPPRQIRFGARVEF